MTTIKEQISADYITAFKAGPEGRAKKNVLGLLKAEIVKEEQKEGRTTGELSNDEVTSMIKSSIKNANKTIEGAEKLGDKQELIDEAKFEISVLEEYLPAKLSEEEIAEKIKEAIAGGAGNMGAIMAAFNGLEVDRKIVAQKAQQQLNS